MEAIPNERTSIRGYEDLKNPINLYETSLCYSGASAVASVSNPNQRKLEPGGEEQH